MGKVYVAKNFKKTQIRIDKKGQVEERKDLFEDTEMSKDEEIKALKERLKELEQ